MKKNFFISISAVFLVQLLSGCVQQSTIPGYAQSGALIQVGLGGIKRNAQSQALTTADISAVITDVNGASFTAKVQNVYKAFPDNTSKYIIERLNPANSISGITLPYDGGWFATVQLVDNSNVALPLATGPARLAISSAKLLNLKAAAYEGDLENLSLEILPGTATPTNDDLGQMDYYTATRHLTIKPTDTSQIDNIGGAQIKIIYNSTAFGSAVAPQVAPASHDPNVHITNAYHDNGDGTTSLTVYVTNPRGFYSTTNWSVGRSSFDDLGLTFTPSQGLRPGTWEANVSIDMANSFYIDVDGNPIQTVTPILAVGKM